MFCNSAGWCLVLLLFCIPISYVLPAAAAGKGKCRRQYTVKQVYARYSTSWFGSLWSWEVISDNFIEKTDWFLQLIFPCCVQGADDCKVLSALPIFEGNEASLGSILSKGLFWYTVPPDICAISWLIAILSLGTWQWCHYITPKLLGFWALHCIDLGTERHGYLAGNLRGDTAYRSGLCSC